MANATNALAMCPGSLASAWAYRRELSARGRLAAVLSPPTVVGALAGAALMHHTPARAFDAIVPVLVLGATVLLLLQGLAGRRAGAVGGPPPRGVGGVGGGEVPVGG